jgi:hypothetical protein
MTPEIVRGGAASVVGLVLETVLGAWLLLLFLLALAWDPLDRRLGFHAKRRAGQLGSRTIALPPADGNQEAFGVGPAPTS